MKPRVGSSTSCGRPRWNRKIYPDLFRRGSDWKPGRGRGSDDLAIVPIRKSGKRRRRQRLIPIGDRSDIVLQRQVTAVLLLGAPAERLDSHADVLLEADRVHDVPA